MSARQAPLLLTMGDPRGVGPEICVKAFEAFQRDPDWAAPLCLVGDERALTAAFSMLDRIRPVIPVGAPEDAADALAAGGAPVIVAGDGAVVWDHAQAGAASHAAIVAAADLALDGRAAGVVTAPIAKEALAAAGVSHPGHTELLAARAGAGGQPCDVAMMLTNGALSTVLVSIHVSLADAIAQVTAANVLRAIRFADHGARALGVQTPRVAVAGLNPHAGEGGLFGVEDAEQIAPAIAQARAEGIDASGPWPGDTVFMNARLGRFDIVVAQYHDQGLIPVKYMGLEEGVNVTLGLPFVRTSPDHGTAFDIAGKRQADPRSMIAAIRLAARLADAGAAV